MQNEKTVYDFEVTDIHGKKVSLKEYEGKVLLIVNVASQCGFTPQYAGLELLYKKLKDQGFVVLGFPCNQFGSQEPGTEKEISLFCETQFGVQFPMFAKVDVNGPLADPLFSYLKAAKKGIFATEGIKWNFTKFLVNKRGEVIQRFAPQVKPESLESDISELLSE